MVCASGEAEVDMMRCLVLAAIAIGWAEGVSAQEQGQLGESSTGKITVSVDIEKRAPMISITELEAVNFDKTDGDQALEDQTISACIYIDQDVPYDVTVVANPLTSGSESYAYDLEVSQSGTSIPNTNTLNISSSTDKIGRAAWRERG